MNNYTGQRGELNFEDDFINQLLQVGWEEVIKKSYCQRFGRKF